MLEDRSVTCYYDAFGRRHCTTNGWSSWGRWVLLGVVIVIFLLFLVCSVCLSRRRARRGARPLYGTGWAVPNRYNNAPQQQNLNAYPQQNNAYAPPAQYGAPQYGSPPQYGSAPYQETGVTHPKPTYGGEQYAPPAGPPPGHQAY